MTRARDLADGTFANDLTVDTDTLYVDSTNNRVGIGTVSPSNNLTIDAGAATGTQLAINTTGSGHNLDMTDATGTARIRNVGGRLNFYGDLNSGGTGSILFHPQGTTEALRIDSSGNFLVGKTSSGTTSTVGTDIRSTGRIQLTVDGDDGMRINRKTSDGDLFLFQKDGSQVGKISTTSGDIEINSASGSSKNVDIIGRDSGGNARGIAVGSGSVRPNADNAIDLGTSGNRYDDIFATNGTIQTSDQNEKQQIASLTDAEITAAKAISQLFKTFKWNDKVAAKGDAARTHTGVIAQDVEAAMTAAGLDAGDYAFFISATWWEHSVDVPAVAEETDDEGNVTVEAQEAYTRIDTYYTSEEAPEGATERTRKGIRYPELLSFVGAATEQRLANIETRLAALEAN